MKIQILEKQVTAPNQTIKLSDELDKDYSHITGVAMLWTNGKRNIIRSSSIDTIELFPKNFEASFLQSNTYVNPNDRFFNIMREADGNKIELEILEGGFQGSYPFDFKIYLRLENCNDEL